jgi:hypothetical protein
VSPPRRAAILALAALAAAGCHRRAAVPDGPQTPPPDLPRAFGPRCVWLAVHGSSTMAVANALGLKGAGPSGWQKGVETAYAGGVFVTPPIDGWVLAASVRFPDAGRGDGKDDHATPLLARLSEALGEVQYFGAHEGIGWSAWARFRDGLPVRKLAVLSAQDAVLWNEGPPTPPEEALGVTVDHPAGAAEKRVDEHTVFKIARAWSVDPSAIEARHLGPSLGVTGSL